MSDKIPQHILDHARRVVAERRVLVDAFVATMLQKIPTLDAQAAPLWAHLLIHTFSQIERKEYPELRMANGEILPVDRSVSSTDLEWEYFQLDSGAGYDLIDESGNVMLSAFVTGERFTGGHHEIGGGYQVNIFDLERWAKAGMVSLPAEYQDALKRAKDQLVEWIWSFGLPGKNIPGFVTHPNIPNVLARQNGGATSRLWANKTLAEKMRDVADLVRTISDNTINQRFAARILMPSSLVNDLMDTYVDATATGMVTAWDRLQARYAGDETGQGKISFEIWNQCDSRYRIDPRTGTDTSGLAGDLLIAMPAKDAAVGSVIESRAMTMRPPQEVDFNVKTLSHAKVGGAKITKPLAFAVMQFGTT